MPLCPRNELAHVLGANGDAAQVVVDQNDLRHAMYAAFFGFDLKVHGDGIFALGSKELGAGARQSE